MSTAVFNSIVLLYLQQMPKIKCLSHSVITFPQFLTIQGSLFLSFQHLSFFFFSTPSNIYVVFNIIKYFYKVDYGYADFYPLEG